MAGSPHPIAEFVKRFWLLLLIIVLGASADLYTKADVFGQLGVTNFDIHHAVDRADREMQRDLALGDDEARPRPRLTNERGEPYQIELVEGHLFFTAVLNPGAFGSFLAGRTEVLILLSLVAVVIVGWVVLRTPTWPYQLSVGLIIAGAIGNNYDRLVFHAVRDFVDFRMPEWPSVTWLNPWNTFNIADACIVVGIILFFALELFRPAEKTPDTDEAVADDAVYSEAVVDTPAKPHGLGTNAFNAAGPTMRPAVVVKPSRFSASLGDTVPRK